MNYFKIPSIFQYGKQNRKFSCASGPGLEQKATFFDTTYLETEPGGQPLALSSHRPWVKVGSLLALAGYMGQIACQFLAYPLLCSGSLWMTQAHSVRAMEAAEAAPKSSSLLSLPLPSLIEDLDKPLKDACAPDPRREALLQNIITVTQAKYDWPCHVTTTLQQALLNLQAGDLKNRLTKLAGQIKQPEDLLFFAPGETERILYRRGLTYSHSVFGSFRSLIQQIGDLLPHLTSGLQDDFQSLKLFYEDYIDALCRCEDYPDRKEELLEQLLAKKVFLKTEKPVDSLKSPSSTSSAESFPSSSAVIPLPSSYGFYRISQEMARQLISKDRYGFTDKKNDTGMRAVQSQGGAHFKFLDASLDDPRPGIEYMAYAFATALTSQFLVTPSVLLKLEGISLLDPTENFPPELLEAKQKGKSLDEALAKLHLQGDWRQFVKLQEHNYFVQASQTIGQQNLGKVLEEDSSFQGDPTTMGWQALFSLLATPGDGKADNYSVDGSLVIGIDNDKLFYPALYRTEKNLYSGVNCVFYLLASLMDNTLPDEVRKPFLDLNPATVVLQWLGLLQNQNKRYQRLAGLGVLKPQDLKTLGLPICLSSGLPEQIMSQIIQLQARLQDHPASTPQQLLYSLHPIVADYYQALREKHYKNDPLGAMWVIYKGRDQTGSLQTIDQVLGLSPADAAWNQAQKSRTNPLNDGLVDCLKAFMPKISQDYLKGHLNQIVSLILDHFEGWADELLPTLPENVWHQIVQEQGQQKIYTRKALDYLARRDPAGLNRLDADAKAPLDIAFEHLKDIGSAAMVTGLINRGAWQMSLSGRQYRNLKLKFDPQQQDHLPFLQAFQSLQERNARVNWTVTLEELFPLAKRPGENTIQGTSGEARFLTETILRQLQDPHHEITQGRRKVIQVAANNCFAYLKFYPELVGLEEAVGELTRRTIGFGAPYGELFRFPDGKPVWVSQGIPGQTLQWTLSNDPSRLTRLDPVSTTQLTLMAMLTNPEDGKPDNYIVEPLPDNPHLYRLSCPDNDHGFVPAFVKTKPDKGGIFTKPELVVQVKTILYCLDLMNQPIPEETKALFLTGDPLVLMKGWLDVMDRRNRRYEALYPSKEASALFRDHQCFMGVPFQKGMISQLYSKWVRFQDCLWEKSLTPLELLNKVEPRLANRYRAAFENPQNKTVWDRFKWVDGGFYHQQGDQWTTVTASGSILTSQNIPMQESALETIRKGTGLGPTQAMKELKEIADQKDQEGLSISHMATDAQRERFLKTFDFGLYAPSEQRKIINQLTPHAANLRNLILKNCRILDDSTLQNRLLLSRDLVCLDLNGCSAVSHDILPTLAQNMPLLLVLNLSNLPKLRWMAKAGLINYDPIPFRQLQTLNLSNCTALEAIDIDAPNLKNLWTAGVKKLEVLKVKAAINYDMLYDLLEAAPNLKPSQVDLTNCPNITAGAEIKRVLEDIGKALRKNDLSAQHRLGMLFFKLKDYQECLRWYQKAIGQGDVAAQNIIRNLGIVEIKLPIPLAALGGHEAIYERFLNGALIYRPDPDSDDGKIEMPIAALANPLEGTFDLSQCGDTGKYLSISTGYKKGRKDENEDKVEIWLTPRFLVEREINTAASHFQKVFPEDWQDDAPVGIFWTWWNDDLKYYDYLTSENMHRLSKNNLYEKWVREGGGVALRGMGRWRDGAKNFMFIFGT